VSITLPVRCAASLSLTHGVRGRCFVYVSMRTGKLYMVRSCRSPHFKRAYLFSPFPFLFIPQYPTTTAYYHSKTEVLKRPLMPWQLIPLVSKTNNYDIHFGRPFPFVREHSCVAEMADRLATIEMCRKVGGGAAFPPYGGARSPSMASNTMWPGLSPTPSKPTYR